MKLLIFAKNEKHEIYPEKALRKNENLFPKRSLNFRISMNVMLLSGNAVIFQDESW